MNSHQRKARRRIARALISWKKTGNHGYLTKAAIIGEYELEDEFVSWVVRWLS